MFFEMYPFSAYGLNYFSPVVHYEIVPWGSFPFRLI